MVIFYFEAGIVCSFMCLWVEELYDTLSMGSLVGLKNTGK